MAWSDQSVSKCSHFPNFQSFETQIQRARHKAVTSRELQEWSDSYRSTCTDGSWKQHCKATDHWGLFNHQVERLGERMDWKIAPEIRCVSV